LAPSPDETTRLAGKVVFADDRAEFLLAGHIAQFGDPQQLGWQPVKQNASRTVWRGEIDGQNVYLKHFHSRTLSHRLGRAMGASDARCEMRFSQYLSRRGVDTPQPLAMMCRNGAEWLATAAVEPSQPAHEWQLAQRQQGPAGRRRIRHAILSAAESVAQMHAAGVLHCDLHAGNMLIRTDESAPRVVLMDLHRMKRRRCLSRRVCVANLAQLMHDRLEWTTRSERLRFLKHYLAVRETGGTLRGWAILIEESAWRHRRRLYAQRERRILSSNRYFRRLRLGDGWRGHVVLASKRRPIGSRAAELTFSADEWRRALARPEQLMLGGQVEKVLKDSASGTVIRRRLKVGPHELDVVIKRPRRKRAWKRLADCFRPARTIRAFRLGHALLTRRIATALPLVALERRVGPLLLDSMLITEYVDAPQLHHFLNLWLGEGHQPAPLDEPQRRQLGTQVLWQMGRLLQRLHDSNFHHRDLKGPNMLVRWAPPDQPQVVLVDLDGLRHVRHLTEKQRFHGLMRLNVSLRQCPCVNLPGQLRMLLGYLRRPGSGRINFKPYWRVLEAWSARKMRQQIRTRRRKQKAVRG